MMINGLTPRHLGEEKPGADWDVVTALFFLGMKIWWLGCPNLLENENH